MIYNYKRFDPFPSPGHVWRGSLTAVFRLKLSLLGLIQTTESLILEKKKMHSRKYFKDKTDFWNPSGK